MKELKKIYITKSDGSEYYIDLESKDGSQDERIQANTDLINANTEADNANKDEILSRLQELETAVNNRFAELQETSLKREDLDDLENTVNDRLQGIENSVDALTQASILTDSLATEVQALAKVVDSKKADVAVTTMSTGDSTLNSQDDVVVTSDSTITSPLNVTALNVEINDLAIENNVSNVVANGIVNLNNFISTGTQNKQTQGNANVKINNSDLVRIVNSKFLNVGYNSLEIGLSATSKPKDVVIDHCEFGDTSNNSILIFNTDDNAVVTVKDCKFGAVSNAIRLSNRDNVHLTLNVIDCDFTDVDTDPAWRSVIICQDYTAKTVDDAVTANRFSPDKIKINFVNCTLRGQKLTEVVTGVGEGKENSLLYVWNSANEYVTDENSVPKITIA